jgi:ribose transport system ATP-binding protein
MSTTDGERPALAVRRLSKSFGGALALDNVDLEVMPGEVHGLLGQNGSGKSTLIKILAGYHAPDPGGELEVRGEPVPLPLDPGQFRALGLSFVHQDLGLVPSLSVLENLRAGELAASRSLHIRWRRERRRARALFGRYNIDLDPSAPVSSLPQVDRALLAIVRAIHGVHGDDPAAAHGILILDEPTVFLPRDRIDRLFALVRQIAASGASVIFVSHNLDEVRDITDRVTVLRDGRVQGTLETRRTGEQDLVELIIGSRLDRFQAQHHDLRRVDVDVAMSGLRGAIVDDLALELHRGEIVGVTGLVGSGFEELPYLLFGATPASAGRLRLGEREHDLTRMTPRAAIEAGIALVPADRQGAGSVGSLSVAENAMLLVLGRYRRGPNLATRRMASDAAGLLKDYDVQPRRPGLDYAALSGGNQQKVMLAKWLQTRPGLIVLHEPTQGVDVGARQQIYRVVKAASVAGNAVLCASSDAEQLAAICDRVLVFARGRVVSELVGADVTKERIAERSYNSMALAEPASGGQEPS